MKKGKSDDQKIKDQHRESDDEDDASEQEDIMSAINEQYRKKDDQNSRNTQAAGRVGDREPTDQPNPPNFNRRENYRTPDPGVVHVGGATTSTRTIQVGDDQDQHTDDGEADPKLLLTAVLVDDSLQPTTATVSAVAVTEVDESQRQNGGLCSALQDRRVACILGFLLLIIAGLAFFLVSALRPEEPEVDDEVDVYAEYTRIMEDADLGLDTSLWDDPFTPQSMAFHWLVENNIWEEDVLDEVPVQEIVDRYVVAVLFFSLGEWENEYGFLTDDESVCQWNLWDEEEDMDYGIGCDDDGILDYLNLRGSMLEGELPTEIGLLARLHILDLSDNSIGGTLPSELAMVISLEILLLNDNEELGGPVPDEFGSLENLAEVDLESTGLSEVEEAFCKNDRDYDRLCFGDPSEDFCDCCTACHAD